MYKISIIIPAFNEANNLPLLLSDLSIFKEDGEIIIVDCGSEDKTIDVANIYGAKVYKSNEKNRGLQLDMGAKNSKGDWLIFLHADTRLTHDWFRKLNLPIFTSSRKWERTNIFLQALKNWNFRRRWSKGESAKSIYSEYYKNN